MSEELLSALLDGECSPTEAEAALAAIARSPELKARWSRMCLTRDALAGVSVAKPSFDFAASVMAAIAAETPAVATESPKVVPMRRPAPVARPVAEPAARPAARGRRWQPMAGLAAAASIAAVAVFGGLNLLSTPIDGGAVQVAGSDNVDNADIVRISADGGISGAQDRLSPDAYRQLNDYMMEHSNSRAEAGMGGSLSYARIAVRSADYRPADGQR